MGPVEELRLAIEAAAAELRNGKPGSAVHPTLERPKKAGFGDYSSNAAMLLAPALGAPPREIAERLAGTLSSALGDRLDHVEVAGPGFLNVFLSEDWFVAALEDLLAAGEAFGTGVPESPEKVLIEFVSANPTGPLTAASGRHAAYGDALARILELAGHAVSREYYFNDSGSQVDRLGLSILARAKGEEPPEDGYQGDYVDALAKDIDGAAELDPAVLAQHGVDAIMTGIRATLDAYRVTFDSWFLERSLHDGDPSAVERVIALLDEKGHVYRSEGAVWLRTTDFGDDKDRVLERSSGETTYFANDVAYHEDKLERGYDRMINPLGSDHHGYIARMKAAMAALGVEPEPARDPDPPVRAHRRGRPPRLDVQAPRRLRDAHRPDRRDRRRRDPLLHAQPLTRVDGRPRPRAGARAVQREPGLLRAVRPCADRLDARQGGRRARRGGAGSGRAAGGAAPGRARADQEAARLPRRGRRGGRAAQPAQASPPTRWSSPRSSRPSTATATSWAPSRRRWRTSASP